MLVEIPGDHQRHREEGGLPGTELAQVAALMSRRVDGVLIGGLSPRSRLHLRLLDEEVTTVYAGLRAATEHPDYQLRSHPDRRYVCVGGI